MTEGALLSSDAHDKNFQDQKSDAESKRELIKKSKEKFRKLSQEEQSKIIQSFEKEKVT